MPIPAFDTDQFRPASGARPAGGPRPSSGSTPAGWATRPGVPAQILSSHIPSGGALREWDSGQVSCYETALRRAAEHQGLVLQKRRGRVRVVGQRVYRLRHWATGALLVHDTAPLPDDGGEPDPDGWASLRQVHAILLNRTQTGRIDRWWNRLSEREQRCLLDNTGQLPERFVAGLGAAGIAVDSPGQCPDSVRTHLARVDAHSRTLARPRVPAHDTLERDIRASRPRGDSDGLDQVACHVARDSSSDRG